MYYVTNTVMTCEQVSSVSNLASIEIKSNFSQILHGDFFMSLHYIVVFENLLPQI